jgi:hypothetical protein
MHQSRGAIVIHGVHVRTRLDQFPDLRVIAIPDGHQQIRRTGSEQHGVGCEQNHQKDMTHFRSPECCSSGLPLAEILISRLLNRNYNARTAERRPGDGFIS